MVLPSSPRRRSWWEQIRKLLLSRSFGFGVNIFYHLVGASMTLLAFLLKPPPFLPHQGPWLLAFALLLAGTQIFRGLMINGAVFKLFRHNSQPQESTSRHWLQHPAFQITAYVASFSSSGAEAWARYFSILMLLSLLPWYPHACLVPLAAYAATVNGLSKIIYSYLQASNLIHQSKEKRHTITVQFTWLTKISDGLVNMGITVAAVCIHPWTLMQSICLQVAAFLAICQMIDSILDAYLATDNDTIMKADAAHTPSKPPPLSKRETIRRMKHDVASTMMIITTVTSFSKGFSRGTIFYHLLGLMNVPSWMGLAAAFTAGGLTSFSVLLRNHKKTKNYTQLREFEILSSSTLEKTVSTPNASPVPAPPAKSTAKSEKTTGVISDNKPSRVATNPTSRGATTPSAANFAPLETPANQHSAHRSTHDGWRTPTHIAARAKNPTPPVPPSSPRLRGRALSA